MTTEAWIVVSLFLLERALTTLQIWLVRRDPSYSRRQDRERYSATPPPPPPPQQFITPAYPQASRYVTYGASRAVQVAGWRCRICGSGPLAAPGICPICEDTEPWRRRSRQETEPVPK